MTEQWFLDLDGVRSGPYQTPEVMSLIAEGEVLPHHRISVGLREQRWTTVLDWRLEQAKIPQTTEPPPTPFSTSKSEVSSIVGLEKIEMEEPKEIEKKGPPIEVAPLPILVPQSETNFSEGNSSIAQKITPITAPSVTPPSPPPPRHSTQQAPSPSHLANVSNRSAPKRDAMAEMFDILQTTKQKREAKQQTQTNSQTNSQTNTQPNEDFSIPPPQTKSSKFGPTSFIAIGITFIGFALGQLFQQTTPPKDPASATSSKPPTSISTAPTAVVTNPPPASTTEIIDRSTEKMTIKGKVERKPEASPPPPLKTISRTIITHKEAPEPVQNEKEIEELQKLKSELRALHALKEKNGGVLDESDDPVEGDDFDSIAPNAGERKTPSELDQFPVR